MFRDITCKNELQLVPEGQIAGKNVNVANTAGLCNIHLERIFGGLVRENLPAVTTFMSQFVTNCNLNSSGKELKKNQGPNIFRIRVLLRSIFYIFTSLNHESTSRNEVRQLTDATTSVANALVLSVQHEISSACKATKPSNQIVHPYFSGFERKRYCTSNIVVAQHSFAFQQQNEKLDHRSSFFNSLLNNSWWTSFMLNDSIKERTVAVDCLVSRLYGMRYFYAEGTEISDSQVEIVKELSLALTALYVCTSRMPANKNISEEDNRQDDPIDFLTNMLTSKSLELMNTGLLCLQILARCTAIEAILLAVTEKLELHLTNVALLTKDLKQDLPNISKLTLGIVFILKPYGENARKLNLNQVINSSLLFSNAVVIYVYQL